MTGVLFKRGNLGMQAHTGRLSYEDEDRNWGDASTGQGMPPIVDKPRSQERPGADISPEPQREDGPAHTLILGFLTSRTEI